jgi:hypothetical protein
LPDNKSSILSVEASEIGTKPSTPKALTLKPFGTISLTVISTLSPTLAVTSF